MKPDRKTHLMPDAADPAMKSILEAARLLVADVGVEGLNMRDLAATTGSSLRTLYSHFGSKDQLLAIVVSDTFEGLIDPIKASHHNNASPITDMIQLATSIEQIAMERYTYVKVIMGLYHKHDTNPEIPNMVYGMMYDRISECVDNFTVGRDIPTREINLLKEEITDRFMSVATKWTHKRIPENDLADRMVFAALPCLATYATPAQSDEIKQKRDEILKRIAA